ncbi:MAG: hypothetical protein P8J50_01790 [Acidimicrobiales bacterium]|jgi:hypothetical protein|nr:hypothetical protein [Acidimicrobiales bacterium]
MNLRALTSERAGTIAALVVFLAALPTLLVWGDGVWYFLDEWSFLANRKLPSMEGFFGDHNGHWVTLPLIAYRINFELFGLHTYFPHQLLVVLAHLTVAGLGHMIMRRMGVKAWLAIALMVGFVFYGAGWDNIVFGFQITLNGSVIAGLVQMLMADHDGPWSRRDSAGLGVAILGLMTSAVFPAVAVGVGAFVLVRRRDWRIAARHTVVPGVVFVVWFLTYGGASESDPHPWRMVQFAHHMVSGALEGLSQGSRGGGILGAILIVGWWRAAAARRVDQHASQFAYVVGLTTAVLVFGLLTDYNRAVAGGDIEGVASFGRYLHVSMGLMLPILGLGVAQLWEWRRPLVLVPLVVIALALPDATDQIRNRPPFGTGHPDQVAAPAQSEFIDQVPESFKPIHEVRASWIIDADAAGDIPDVSSGFSVAGQLNADASLALVTGPTHELLCEPAVGRISQTIEAGTQIFVDSAARVMITQGDVRSFPMQVAAGSTVTTQAGPVDVLVIGAGDADLSACVVPPS